MRDPANPGQEDSNHYAFPLPISPVLESNEYKVVRIDILPTGADNTIKPVQPYQSKPANEYVPECVKLRTDLKPLQVIQPEGASFKLTSVGETGYLLDWQKWTFRVGEYVRLVLNSILNLFQVTINEKASYSMTSDTTLVLYSTVYLCQI